MNGYDAQDMATQGAEGFRNGYQAGYADAVKAAEVGKPAAAQEAVRQPDGYHYRYPDLYGADTYIRKNNGEEVNGSKPVEAVPYWYAPVTAAPACLAREGRPAGTNIPCTVCKSTPAAPGIDLTPVKLLVLSWRHMEGGNGSMASQNRKDAFRRCANDLENALKLIDASPKGGSGRGRYFCDGPEGYFFCDDLQLARDLVNGYDTDEDWTITDLQATSAEVGS